MAWVVPLHDYNRDPGICSSGGETISATKYKLVWFIRTHSRGECVGLARDNWDPASSFVNTAKPKSVECIATSALQITKPII